jgi:sialate O-acetylesterase
MRTNSLCLLALFLLSAITAPAADNSSLPFVSPIFGDNMILQRGKPNTIWGWSKPGEIVQVGIAGRTAKTVTGSQGRWQVKIEPPAPGGPYTIKVVGPQTVTFRDVLVGDVWLCGGQSNMQFGLPRARNGSDEIKAANHPEIRLYVVSQHVSYSRTAVPQGSWRDLFAPDRRRGRRIFGGCLFLRAESTGRDKCADRTDSGLRRRLAGRSLDQPGNASPFEGV